MAKILFDIVAEGNPNYWQQYHLTIEIGCYNLLYVVIDEAKELVRLRHYELEISSNTTLLEELQQIQTIDTILAETYKTVTLVYNFPDNQLVPDAYFNASLHASMQELMHGDLQKATQLSERIQGYKLYNIFNVPSAVHQFFKTRFKEPQYYHYYTLWLQCCQAQLLLSEERIEIVFYPTFIVLAAIKNKQLQLVQQFAYQKAEDVAYHLLNISQQLSLSPTTTLISMSGTLVAASPMYTEIQKYFAHASLDAYMPINTTTALRKYPPHFFSPILKLAACVL
jgi:hypothetical protein